MAKVELEPYIKDSINKQIDGTNFNSVEEYVNFVLDEVVHSDSLEHENKEDGQEHVNKQLKDLGYL